MGGNGEAIRVQLLGPVRAWRGEQELELGGPRRRAVFSMLAMRAGQPVSRSQLIDGLWGEDPPVSAVNSIHVYVAGLRRVLEPRRANRAPGLVLPASGPGYLLRLEPWRLDARALSHHLAQAHQPPAGGERELEAAARELDAALDLWQGIPLSGIPGPWADAERLRLDELRLGTVEQSVDMMLALGRHREVVAQLTGLIREHPLRERFREQLMLALYRSGRQADALREFAAARRLLGTELGIEPGPGLRGLHQQILTGDAGLDLTGRAAGPAPHVSAAPPAFAAPHTVRTGRGTPAGYGPAAGHGGSPPVPRELPADVAAFTGRVAEMAGLDRLLGAWERQPGQGGGPPAVVISAVAGTAGVGKTALAVRWAHRVRGRFPGGQLYVNLRGYDPGDPLAAADALAGFLRALGLAGQDIPADAGERAARYRSLLDGRRMLILLDNVSAVEQVRPLLPGTPSCFVVVTSRDSLAGLVARDGARRLSLDPMPLADAITLLRVLIGARVDADLASAATLASRCARLPLALRVAAEFAVGHPALTLAQLAGALDAERAGAGRRLDLLDADGDPRTAVRAVLSWSYRHLRPAAARAFRLAGAHPAPDLGLDGAAALFGTSAGQAADLLSELRRAHLVHLPGARRYGMHDLLRAYAADLLDGPGPSGGGPGTADPAEERTGALTRLLHYYVAASVAAMDVLVPAERHRRPRPACPASRVPQPSSPAAARAWLDTERDTLLALAAHAAVHGWPGHATRLSAIVSRYLETGGHYTEAVTLHTHARAAARRSGDRAAEAHALNNLGIVSGRLGRYEEGDGHLRQALALFREIGDHGGAARALGNLGSGDWRQGRYQQAARYHQESLALFREIGDGLGEARALNSLGLVRLRTGQFPAAARYFRQSLDLYSRLGDLANQAHAVGNLGLACLRMGAPPQAAGHLARALALSREIGDRSGEASALTDLGALACAQGLHREAARYHRQALALFRRMGERTGEAEAQNGLGEVLLATGRLALARDCHAAALELASAAGDPHEQSRARAGLRRAARATPSSPSPFPRGSGNCCRS